MHHNLTKLQKTKEALRNKFRVYDERMRCNKTVSTVLAEKNKENEKVTILKLIYKWVKIRKHEYVI